MVDVDRRLACLAQAHAAGLNRLYACAASAARSTLSLHSLAENVLTCLRGSGTPLDPGFTDEEFAVSEAEFSLVFPLDLRAVLSSLVWPATRVVQCGNDLSDLFNQVSRFGKFASSQNWYESFKLTNQSGYTSKSLDCSRRHPWWNEFWSDIAAVDEQRRKSVSSSLWPSSPGRFVEMLPAQSPSSPGRFVEMLPAQSTQHWVDEYVEGIASSLKDGGWSEQDVREMTVVPAIDFFREEGIAALDGQVVLDMLLLKVDRFVEMTRNAGWSTDDVSNALEHGLRLENEQRMVRLPPWQAERFEKLA